MTSIFLLTYAAVFAAELVGDKLLYTASTLAARYRAVPIVAGVTCAFMLKMGAAVLVGGALARIPRPLIAAITTASFLGVAYAMWRKPYRRNEVQAPRERATGALMAFVVVLGSEWGDLGQITTATMAARFESPMAVWLGAVAAMTTKGILAAWLGAGVRAWLRGRLSPQMVRYGSVGLLLLVGGLSVAESLLGEP